jgi:hypothetical protein
LDEGVKLDEGVRPAVGREVLGRLVGLCEFRVEVGQVCEGEFAWVRAVADAEEGQVAVYDVAVALLAVLEVGICSIVVRSANEEKLHVDVLVGVVSALYAGLRFRSAVKAALYELDLALCLVELGVCLEFVRL